MAPLAVGLHDFRRVVEIFSNRNPPKCGRQRATAAAPGGWPCLEKIDAPRHRSTRDILGSAARSGDARYHLNCCTQLTRISEVLGGRETFTRSELSGFGPKALIYLATSPSSPELPAREFRAFSQGGELRLRDLGMDPSTEATVDAGNHIFAADNLCKTHDPSGDVAEPEQRVGGRC
jgi:hypothetical protein